MFVLQNIVIEFSLISIKKRVFQNCDGESENFKCKTIRVQLWTVTQRNHLYKNEQLLRTKQRYN